MCTDEEPPLHRKTQFIAAAQVHISLNPYVFVLVVAVSPWSLSSEEFHLDPLPPDSFLM